MGGGDMDWPLSCVQMIFITVPCMRLSCCLVALGGGRTVHPNLGWKSSQLPLVASVSVSLCVIMWRWRERDVEKNPIKPASDDGSARGRTKVPVRGKCAWWE